MLFRVDDTLIWDNCFYIITDEGNTYCVKLDETAPGSSVWILNFLLVDGEPNNKEVFRTLQTFWINLKKLLLEKNINTVLAYIDGKTRKERDKKTKVFTRWIDEPFECFVDENPEIRIQGKRSSIYPDTNFIRITKKGWSAKEDDKKQNSIENSKVSIMKFCFNCGLENKEFKFCPSCGQNLQQK